MQGLLGIAEDAASGEVLSENLSRRPYDGTLRYIYFIIERYFAGEAFSKTQV
jgi:hypothetical protein